MVVEGTNLFPVLPDGLRVSLLEEYRSIVQNYLEHRWSPTELSGGRFCETVYSILHGHAAGSYPATPSKPRDFVGACRSLESNIHVPRSFQILIPRLLPALYEIRNNRGVGHVGGDVDPNHMDATAVFSMASWIMAELVRVFHSLPIVQAQQVVDSLVERRSPLVWIGDSIKRVLNPKVPLKDVIVILLATSPTNVAVSELFTWSDCKDKSYFMKLLRDLHSKRILELAADESSVELLPPGSRLAERLMTSKAAELGAAADGGGR